jgi:lipopolysaccharide/colanic/teichoic acid biosynthesis glycosyltransferase
MEGERQTMKPRELISRVAAGLLLTAIAPVVAVCALALVVGDGGPVLFHQRRIGRNGKPFDLLKLRTMKHDSRGALITARGDSRITRIGTMLRNYKIDELPQLWNILRGEMSFIGPRPEVPQYVDLSDPRWQMVLSVKPGITDLASLAFRNEELLLLQQSDIERFYRDWLLPRKLDMSAYYIAARSFTTDAKLIALTIRHSVLPHQYDRHTIAKQFAYEGSI